ncbi:MAG: hypothetical protein DI556_13140 [Rhodovulum sulfidophilum]|uniref:Uncharacterized protein n=1 Tax=Rhodovulum sulfidophilum TaxID=35806 RepID=A0A2W5PVF9_RHOSU|nr:MAG: hypothetical protein DI556_13140 [Rhodovulum sulfidophilum]
MKEVATVTIAASLVLGAMLGALALARPSPEQLAARLVPSFPAINGWAGSARPDVAPVVPGDKVALVLSDSGEDVGGARALVEAVLAEIPENSVVGLVQPAEARSGDAGLADQLDRGADLLAGEAARAAGAGRYYLIVVGQPGNGDRSEAEIQALRGTVSRIVRTTPIQVARIGRKGDTDDPLYLPGAVWAIDQDQVVAGVAEMLAPDLAEYP